jgi:hypothetical protein
MANQFKEKTMNFNTVSMVKHPIDQVWTIMRDDLPKLVELLEDIEGIHLELYEKKAHICKVVNIWKASPRLLQVVASRLDSDMFVWTDHAEWNEKKMECLWNIEPHRFRDKIRCSGATKFSSAIGGRGTRINFSGNFELNNQNLPEVLRFLEEPMLQSLETLIKNLIPKNFHKMTDALARHLDTKKV